MGQGSMNDDGTVTALDARGEPVVVPDKPAAPMLTVDRFGRVAGAAERVMGSAEIDRIVRPPPVPWATTAKQLEPPLVSADPNAVPMPPPNPPRTAAEVLSEIEISTMRRFALEKAAVFVTRGESADEVAKTALRFMKFLRDGN